MLFYPYFFILIFFLFVYCVSTESFIVGIEFVIFILMVFILLRELISSYSFVVGSPVITFRPRVLLNVEKICRA